MRIDMCIKITIIYENFKRITRFSQTLFHELKILTLNSYINNDLKGQLS